MSMITFLVIVAWFFSSVFANIISSNLSLCNKAQYQHVGVGGARRTVLQDGGVLIQGIFPLSSTRDNCQTILQNGLVAMMALKFAIERLKNGSFPGNSSDFGYHIDDSCNSIPTIMARAIEIVSQFRDESVCKKRSCNDERTSVNRISAVVGPFQSFTSIPFSSLLGLQNIPIVSPSASSRLLSKKDLYRSFTRIIPSDIVQARVIAEMLHRFSWNYIFVIGSDDNYGKLGVSILKDYTEEYKFCIVADDYIPYATSRMESKAIEIVDAIEKNPNAKVVVVFAYNIQIELILSEAEKRKLQRLWIMSDAFALSGEGPLNITDKQIIGLFKVSPKSEQVSGFREFLEKEVRMSSHCNIFLKLFMEQEFGCIFNKTSVFCPNQTSESISNKLFEVNSNLIGNTIDAMTAISVAVQKFYLDHCNHTFHDGQCPHNIRLQPYSLTKYLFNVSFTNVYGNTFEFDKNGDPKYPSYDIGNVQRIEGKLKIVKIGGWEPLARLTVDLNRVVWPFWTANAIPKSTCSEDCPIGHYIAARTECCWSCEKCLINTVTSMKNAFNCTSCPDGFVSNSQRSDCIKYNYVTLKADDVAGVAIIIINTIGIVSSILIFVGYRYFRRSNVIKIHTRMPHVLPLSLVQLVVSFAYGELLLMNRSNTYCSAVVGSMYVLRTGFAVLIFSRTRLFLSILQRCAVPNTTVPLHLSHFAITLILILIQVGLTITCTVIDPVLIKVQALEVETLLALDCSFDYTTFQAVAFLVYPNLVLLVATIATMRERSQRHASSESKLLNFAAIANCILSVAYFPTYKYVVGIYKTILMAFTIDVCAFVYICCLMLPHLYVAYTSQLRVSSPREADTTEMSPTEIHRAKYRKSLPGVKEGRILHMSN